jgi:predicted MFS family arabinose efflux permease
MDRVSLISCSIANMASSKILTKLRPYKHLGPLENRNLLIFLSGLSLSLTGSAMTPVALSFTTFAHGGGPAETGALLAAMTVPFVLLLLVGGTAADRFSPRTVMLGADLMRCGSQSALAFVLLTRQDPFVAIIVLIAVIGLGNAFYMPGQLALLVDLVCPEQRQAANGLTAIARSMAAIIGPALGGMMVGAIGPGWTIGLDAASYALSAICLSQLRMAANRAQQHEPIWQQLIVGWNALRSRLWLWLIIIHFGLIQCVVQGPLLVLGAYSYAHTPHGAEIWGGLLACYGAGTLVGGVMGTRLRPRFPLRAALSLFAVTASAPAALAVPLPTIVRGLVFTASGVGLAACGVLWATTMQREIPTNVLARVSAYSTLGSVLLLPVGYVVATPMANTLGISGTFWAAAVLTLLSTLLVVLCDDVRTREAIATSPVDGQGQS